MDTETNFNAKDKLYVIKNLLIIFNFQIAVHKGLHNTELGSRLRREVMS